MELDGHKMHCFDGHGLIAKIAFKNGQACFKSRYVRTEVANPSIPERQLLQFCIIIHHWLLLMIPSLDCWASSCLMGFLCHNSSCWIILSIVVRHHQQYLNQIVLQTLRICKNLAAQDSLHQLCIFKRWMVSFDKPFAVVTFDKQVYEAERKAGKVLYRGFGSMKPGGIFNNFMDFK